MSKKASGCGCGTIVVLWFIVFAFCRVCGFTEVSWWYSIAPIWWPLWVLIKLLGLLIGVAIIVVLAIAAIGFLFGRKDEVVPEVEHDGYGAYIDVECEVEGEK